MSMQCLESAVYNMLDRSIYRARRARFLWSAAYGTLIAILVVAAWTGGVLFGKAGLTEALLASDRHQPANCVLVDSPIAAE